MQFELAGFRQGLSNVMIILPMLTSSLGASFHELFTMKNLVLVIYFYGSYWYGHLGSILHSEHQPVEASTLTPCGAWCELFHTSRRRMWICSWHLWADRWVVFVAKIALPETNSEFYPLKIRTFFLKGKVCVFQLPSIPFFRRAVKLRGV